MKKIEDYTAEELSAKINAIKAEREKTANALKRYEEEMERRKQEAPLGLGVPFVPKTGEEYWWVDIGGNPIHTFFGGGHFDFQVLSECGCFKSYASAQKHVEMLLAWRKTLVANAKDEPIDINVLAPLLKKGWVAYDNEYGWIWFKNKPFILRGTEEEDESWGNEGIFNFIGGFNIKPADNWETSLMECGV